MIYIGLNEIKSKCAVWLSKLNYKLLSELILQDYESLNNVDVDQPAFTRSPVPEMAKHAYLNEYNHYRQLILMDAVVDLPVDVVNLKKKSAQGNESGEVSRQLKDSMGLFNYNHEHKVRAQNIVYKRPYATYDQHHKHWSEYGATEDVLNYAKKYDLDINHLKLNL